MALRQLELGTAIYTPANIEWRAFGHPRRKRALESVVLDESVAENIVKDVKEFINRSQWYFDRGKLLFFKFYIIFGSRFFLNSFRHSLSQRLFILRSARMRQK